MWKFFVRYVIKPLLDALRTEAGIVFGSPLNMDAELRKQLEALSKEHLKSLLDVKVVKDQGILHTELVLESARLTAIEAELKKMQEREAALLLAMNTYRGEIKALATTMLASKKASKVDDFIESLSKRPRTAKTEVVEFG